MKKALLPAVISGLLTAQSAVAADRDFLFGPDIRRAEPVQAERKAAQAQRRDRTAQAKSATIERASMPEHNSSGQKPFFGDTGGKSDGTPKIAVKRKPIPEVQVQTPAVTAANDIPMSTARESGVASKTKEGTPNLKAAAALKLAGTQDVPAAPTASNDVADARAAAGPIKQGITPAPPAAERASSVQSTTVQTASPAPLNQVVTSIAASQAAPPPPKTEDLKAIGVGLGADAFAEREHLISQLRDTLSVGVPATAGTNVDAFSFLVNYLPLANFVSSRLGVLVNVVSERDGATFRRALLEAKYPFAIVTATNAVEAMQVGYVPLVTAVEEESATFVVRSDSKLQVIDDVHDLQIAWPKNTQIAVLAQYELSAKKLAGRNKFNDIGTAGAEGAAGLLAAHAIDVVIMRAADAKRVIDSSGGKYRSFGTDSKLPQMGIWARPDLRDSDLAKRLSSAMLEIGTASSATTKSASAPVGGAQFKQVSDGDIDRLRSISSAARQAFPEFGSQEAFNLQARAANLATSAVTRGGNRVVSDAISENSAIRSKYMDAFRVGIYTGGTLSSDPYAFQGNFIALSTYLSTEAGYSVGLVPERNANLFIRRLAQNEYPAVVISPTLAYAAASSGYLPVARGSEFVTSAFLVPSSSAVKSLQDLSEKRVAAIKTADASNAGKWDLLRAKAVNVRFEYFGGNTDGIAALTKGTVDAVLMPLSDAEKLAKPAGAGAAPDYKIIAGTEKAPVVSVWVRSDVVEHDAMRKLATTLGELAPSGSPAKVKAFDGIARGFDTRAPWQASGLEEHRYSVDMGEGLLKASLSVVDEAQVDAAVVDRARSRSFLARNLTSNSTTMKTSSARVAAK